MRNGDFAVEVVARGKGVGVRETGSGHVLARPGQVYALRIRNFGPLRCVAEVSIDGRNVTAGGLVIEPWCTEELERPITSDEDGRFTVVAEGDERVFGPDGGRENPDLGLIEAHFRRELPGGPERARPLPPTLMDTLDRGPTLPLPATPPRVRPEVSPIWNVSASAGMPNGSGGRLAHLFGNMRSPMRLPLEPPSPSLDEDALDDVERAAGTGLTGHSEQRFTPTQLGPLESESTVVQLRLVIASAETIQGTPSPAHEQASPARPAARP
jgi:hypothetical protein